MFITIVASFSSSHGLFILPACICVAMMLFISKEARVYSIDANASKKIVLSAFSKNMLFFVLVTILLFCVYFYGYQKPGHHPEYFGHSIIKAAEYFLIAVGTSILPRYFLGNELAFRSAAAGLIVLVVLSALILYVIKQKRVLSNAFPLCLLFFGLFFVLSITAGRAGFGISQALSSRYTTFSSLIIIGILLIAYNELILTNHIYKTIATVGVYIVFLLVLISNLSAFDSVESFTHKSRARTILLSYKTAPLEELRTLYPWTDKEQAQAAIELVEKNKWSAFYKNNNEGR